jgi:hypothetical protein
MTSVNVVKYNRRALCWVKSHILHNHYTLQDALLIDHIRVVVSMNWFIDIALSIYLSVG